MRCFRCDEPIQEYQGTWTGPHESTRCAGTALRHSPHPDAPPAPKRPPAGLKAKLTVRLLVQEGDQQAVVVAESHDPELWQRILAAVHAEPPEQEHSGDPESCARCTVELGRHTGCTRAQPENAGDPR